jgi:4-amino-4-deoxy-L-arabinose transferase-like glycosyltransferase
VSILVMYRVVRRWAGATPGLLAALIFALTPIAASMFGHSMEDGALTMCLVLAADSWQRAVIEGRLRSLLWAAVWVGLGFQAKMLQAWMVLPALVIGYLACASPRLGRRLWHLAAFGVVTAAVSLSWILLYTLTPAADRPYVDGSTDNSAFAMVFGYNGLERFGISVPGSVTSGPGVTTGGGGGGGGGVFHTAANGGFGTGWTKLLGSSYGPEIGWLYPLAALALICGLLWTHLYDYVSAHRDGASYLMAVTSWTEASPYILGTGQEVMPMGGFSGSVPEPTLARVQQLVRGGQLKFFLLSSSAAGGFGARAGGSATATAIEAWVKSACAVVPATDYGGTAASSVPSGLAGAQVLYECRPGA